MSSSESDSLVDEIVEDLTPYLNGGSISRAELNRDLEYEGLDIDNFDRLKDIHFALSESVVEFVEDLPYRLRRISTEHGRVKSESKGEIHGSVDWDRTFERRYEQNPDDPTLFVCNTPVAEYDLPENLVLRKLVEIVSDIVTSELTEIDYDWRTGRWSDELITRFQRTRSKNVHLNRIQNPDEFELSGRILSSARKSRKPLYQNAYSLYTTYEDLQENNFGSDSVRQLLTDTVVRPGRKEVLFELFVLCRLLRAYETINNLSLRRLESTATKFAHLSREDCEIRVYHRRQGDSVTFSEPIDRDRDYGHRFLQREQAALREYEQTFGELLDGSGINWVIYTGQPDFIFEEYYDRSPDSEPPDRVIIGEVKRSSRRDTIREGLRELAKYAKFARYPDSSSSGDPQYLDDSGSGTVVEKVLVTQDFETASTSPEVVHLQSSDLRRSTGFTSRVEPLVAYRSSGLVSTG
ncbi:hypothetical protein [Halorhabdus amylolytica]|uniref:hypothetical protein n=1 Tax=Halorhabdus amylolytica TaxID=2559573 RepID=UPI0010AAACCC|nr:hypothetical protein [Halorhabdus amylolytica]